MDCTAEVGMKLHVCSIDKNDMQVICSCRGHVRFDQGGSQGWGWAGGGVWGVELTTFTERKTPQ